MTSAATGALAGAPLFAGLDAGEAAEIAAATAPWHAPRGALLFRQGEPGDRLLVLTSGRLQVLARSTSGEQRGIGVVQPGEVVGELALLYGGRRTATVVAGEDSAGIALERHAFAYLRAQRRRVALLVVQRIGDTALRRLHRRYVALAAALPPGPGRAGEDAPGDGPPPAIEPIPGEHVGPGLFFAQFTDDEAAELRGRHAVVRAERRADLGHGDAVWIVLAGAVETLLDNGGAHRRVRLAGPGRAVGHLAVRAGHDHGLPLRARLRERAVLLKVPAASADEYLASEAPFARRFAEAFYEDAVRALVAVETMQVPVVERAAVGAWAARLRSAP